MSTKPHPSLHVETSPNRKSKVLRVDLLRKLLAHFLPRDCPSCLSWQTIQALVNGPILRLAWEFLLSKAAFHNPQGQPPISPSFHPPRPSHPRINHDFGKRYHCYHVETILRVHSFSPCKQGASLTIIIWMMTTRTHKKFMLLILIRPSQPTAQKESAWPEGL